MPISRKSWAALLIAAVACLALVITAQMRRQAEAEAYYAAPYCAHGYENLWQFYIKQVRHDGDFADAKKLVDLLDKAPDKSPQGPSNNSLRKKL